MSQRLNFVSTRKRIRFKPVCVIKNRKPVFEGAETCFFTQAFLKLWNRVSVKSKTGFYPVMQNRRTRTWMP